MDRFSFGILHLKSQGFPAHHGAFKGGDEQDIDFRRERLNADPFALGRSVSLLIRFCSLAAYFLSGRAVSADVFRIESLGERGGEIGFPTEDTAVVLQGKCIVWMKSAELAAKFG